MKKTALTPVNSTRLINHGPVVMVTSGADKPNIFTAAWNMPVAREENSAIIAIAVNPDHYSYHLIKEHGQFVLNIPGMELLDMVILCGSTSGREIDKFKETGLTPVKAQAVDVPLIGECIGHIECIFEDEPRPGLILGRVVAASVAEELFDEVWKIEEIKNRTIHHLGGKYFCYPAERVKS